MNGPDGRADWLLGISVDGINCDRGARGSSDSARVRRRQGDGSRESDIMRPHGGLDEVHRGQRCERELIGGKKAKNRRESFAT